MILSSLICILPGSRDDFTVAIRQKPSVESLLHPYLHVTTLWVFVCVLAHVYRHVPDRYLQYANQCQSHAVGMEMTAAALFLYFTPIYGNTWRWFVFNLDILTGTVPFMLPPC